MTGDPARDLFEPPYRPYQPTRVRAMPVLVVLVLLVGTLVGAYYLAKAAGWLEPSSPIRDASTLDGIGIKSRITYPAEPAQLASVNHRDLTQEQLDALRRELEAQRKLLEAHLASKHGATTGPATAPAAAKPQAKKALSRISYERKEPVTDTLGETTDLFAGTFIPGVLITRLNSDREGTSVVRVREHVKDSRSGRHILIPEGSTMVMRYKSKDLIWGDERLEVGLDTLTLPNGRVIDLPKEPGIDQIGQAGWVSEVNRHYWRLLSAVLIRGVLRGGAQVVNTQIGVGGAGGVASGLAQEGAQVGQQQTQPFVNTRPTIMVWEGEPVNLQLTKGISLPPYQEPLHALR